MEYVQLTLDDWVQMKQKLKQELLGVKQSFVRIGYVLRQIDDQKLYEQDGYKSIAEFAQAEYGLGPSITSRFMSINKEYSVDGYSEHLRPEYADMGRSQLEEMLKLAESDRQMIHPETSREDIRELKRFNKSTPDAEQADSIEKLVQKFYEINPETMKKLEQSAAYAEWNIGKMAEIVNPSGTRTFRMGMFFAAMYEQNLQIKQFGQTPQPMSWEEFFEISKKIFEKKHEETAMEHEEIREEHEQEETSEDQTIHQKNDSDEGEMEAEEQPPEDVHPKTQQKEKTETTPIAPAQSEMPETIVNTEKETISVDPKEPEREAPKSTEEEKSGTVQLKDAQKVEEKVFSEPEIVQNETEDTQIETENGSNETQSVEAEPENIQEEQLPGQMNLPADYPGTESIEVVGKAMPRKDYFDTLTAWGLSVYLSKYLPADVLADQKKLYQWMQKLVDERGYEFEQEGGADA